MNFRVLPVNNYVQAQNTFTVQLPLFQLTYVRYTSVHVTIELQQQGFPNFSAWCKLIPRTVQPKKYQRVPLSTDLLDQIVTPQTNC